MKKWSKLAGIFVLSMVMLCGCGQGEIKEAKDDDKIQIGLSFDSFVVERWQRDRDVFVSTASELDADVNVQNANGDADKQVSQIEYFIEKGVDVIVVVPIDSYSLLDVIKKAKDKGIICISYDRLVTNADMDMYVSFDNEAVGTLMGKEVVKRLNKEDKVMMLCGSQSDNNVRYVEKGFETSVLQKQLKIVDKTYIENWKAELAADYVREHIDEVKQVQAIMCGNDNIAAEVIKVLAENCLAGEILVTGQDADLTACQQIVEGTQTMTVYKPVEKLAKVAAQTAVSLAKKEVVEYADTINDGKNDIPYLKLEPLAVTVENIDATIIGSGFHTKEDVYRY